MSKMNDRERFEAALNLEEVDRVSLAAPLQTGTTALMQASGAYWPEAHHNSEKMAKLALAAHEFAGIESVCVPFHNDYEAVAMGCTLGGFSKTMFPSCEEFAVKTPEDIDNLRVPDPKKDGELPIVLEAVSLLSKKLEDKVPVVARIPDPFELACRVGGVTGVLRMVLERPDDVKKLLKIAVETGIEYGKALINSGASTVTLVCGTSSTMVDRQTGPKYYLEFSLPFQQEVIRKLGTLTVLHICSDTTPILKEMGESGANGLSIDSPVNVTTAKEILGSSVAIVGNVNALNILGTGTPEKVKVKAREALEKGVDVLTAGCGFPPQTPLENMKALVQTGLIFSQ